METQYAVSAALGRDQTAYHVLPLIQVDFVGAALVACPLRYHVLLMPPAGPASEEKSYQATNPNQYFNMRFDAQGACIANDGMLWNLSVREWGYGDEGTSEFSADQASPERGGESAWQAVTDTPLLRYSVTAASAVRLSVSANRVEYRRGTLTEWYVNGPLGLQQGFTVQAPPARRSLGTGGPVSRGPLTFVLNLPGGGQAQVDADRTGLTLLTDEKERTCPPAYIAGRSPAGRQSLRSSVAGGQALRYSGLTAFDADGVRLPAWLEIQNHNHAQPCEALGKRVVKLLLRVDDAQARYPIAIDPFIQQAKLTAVDGAADDYVGNSVALNDAGDTVIVGAVGADVSGNVDQGAAYVFTRSGTAWSQQVKLTVAGGAAVDLFGYAVALSSNGNTAIVGAPLANVSGNADQGAAYVFTRSGTAWSQQVKLTAADGAADDYFGMSVALSGDGDTVCSGAYGADVSGNVDQGAAYIFTRSGDFWSQQAKLTAADGIAGDLFSRAVALSGEGNTAGAGAYTADVSGNLDQGAVYVFTRSGTAWTQQAKLIAADGATSDFLGRSVALSGDGDTACSGAYGADVSGNVEQGAAYVFTRSGAAWSQQVKLIALDGVAGDLFGRAVALSGDGDTALAGAYGADVGGNVEQGAAYVFTRSGAAWSQQVKLTAADGAADDIFGYTVALSSAGNIAIVGAYFADVGGNANQGAAYVFAVPTPPTGIAATDDFYIDRVRVTWDAAAGATGYEVWRGASNATGQATNIGMGIAETNYDDMNATAGTSYYYWVKATNAGGTSAFSASAMGKVLLGPDVRVNASAGPVTIAMGSELIVTVSLNPAQNVGAPRDWWVAASTPFGLYYLNSGMAWTPASDFSFLRPVHQGGLFGLQSAVALDIATLPAGTYTFYFGTDTLNGILDPDVAYDSAIVTVTP